MESKDFVTFVTPEDELNAWRMLVRLHRFLVEFHTCLYNKAGIRAAEIMTDIENVIQKHPPSSPYTDDHETIILALELAAWIIDNSMESTWTDPATEGFWNIMQYLRTKGVVPNLCSRCGHELRRDGTCMHCEDSKDKSGIETNVGSLTAAN